MEGFNYIESALVLAINDLADLQKITFSNRDFSLHGNAFDFVITYIEDNKSKPPISLLEKKFPELDFSAKGVSIDYSLENFRKQVLYRKTVETFNDNKDLLKENPQKAITNIVYRLGDIELEYDEEVFLYDAGREDRFDEYLKRKEIRQKGLKMLGIPTFLRSINRTGIGWMPGEIATLFARPGTGKTWVAAKTAAIAAKYGYKVLLVIPEMPVTQISLRFDVCLGQLYGFELSHRGIRRGELSSKEEETYHIYLKTIDTRKLMICDGMKGQDLTLSTISRLVTKRKPDLLVIDGMQLLPGEGREAGWERLQTLFYGIKRQICIKNGISSFVTTQANSRKAIDKYEPPRERDVYMGESAFQASDFLLSMCLVEDMQNRREVQLQKVRDSEDFILHNILLEWDVDRGYIKEVIPNDGLA